MRAKLFIIVFFILSNKVFGSAWDNSLIGIRQIGMGGATLGLADDPSSVIWNPGGLSFIESKMIFSLGSFFVVPDHQYSKLDEDKYYHSNKIAFLPQLFVSYRTGKLGFGFAGCIPYAGGGMEWDVEDFGYGLDAGLGVFSFSPSISYRVLENLGIGFTFNYDLGLSKSKYDIPRKESPTGRASGERDYSGSSISWIAGIRWLINEKLSFGFSLRSPFELKLKGNSKIYEPVSFEGNTSMEFKLPWYFNTGVAYKYSEKVIFVFDFAYNTWSQFERLLVTQENVPFIGSYTDTTEFGFHNIIRINTGIELSGENIKYRFGIGYDQNAVSEGYENPENIDVDKLVFTTGFGFNLDSFIKNTWLDISLLAGFGNEVQNKEDSLKGDGYPGKYNLNVFIIGLSLKNYIY